MKNDTPVTILLVEDNPGDVRLIREALAEAPEFRYELVHVETLAAAREYLRDRSPCVVLLDLSLPDGFGMESVSSLRPGLLGVPVVVLTGLDDASVAVRAVQAGAQDYLVKGRFSGELLARAVRYAIERHRLQSELRALSLTDDVTGLHNGRSFRAHAEHQLKHAARSGRDALLLFFDMDGLKQINDALGHDAGTAAIRDAAAVLRKTFRGSDIVARLGGDEFAVLAVDTVPDSLPAIRARLCRQVEAFNETKGRPYELAFSAGAADFRARMPATLDELLREADALMYAEKRARRAALLGKKEAA